MPYRTVSKTPARQAPQAKKSFTLSRSSVVFLERLREQQNAPSTSAVLDQLLREAEEQQRKSAFERAMVAYYDTLPEEEQKEQQRWGNFSLSQMSGDMFE